MRPFKPPDWILLADACYAGVLAVTMHGLGHRVSKANALLAGIEDGVVGTHEHVAQDPQRPCGLWKVQTHEAADALLLAARINL